MDQTLLDKFFAGACSEAEAAKVLAWFADNQLSAAREQELYALWQQTAQVTPAEVAPHDAEGILAKIREQLPPAPRHTSTTGPEAPAPEAKVRRLPLQTWLKYAAVILVPLCLAGMFWALAFKKGNSPRAYMAVTTAPGIKKTINLTDGSVIRLNAGSKVTFPKAFPADKREIILAGEAFFEVAKDRHRPFIVHTGAVSTQALGTSFNINYRPAEKMLAVALATGVVKIDRQQQVRHRQLARLVPGQQLAYNPQNKRYSIAPFNAHEAFGWKDGILSFKKASRDQIIHKLENWYGVAIEIDTAAANDTPWNYTGEYHNETIDSVLEGIGFVNDFTFTRTGNKVRIRFNDTNS